MNTRSNSDARQYVSGFLTTARRGLFIAILWLLSLPPVRVAVAAAPDPELLFREGLERMQAGDFETGCSKLAESYRLDPLPGALFTLAECEAAWGKSATAIEHYQEFLSKLTSVDAERRANYDERRRVALDKIAALSSVVPKLTVQVGSDAVGLLVVKRNGEVVKASSYGVTRGVDPGRYHLVAEAGGEVVWERHVLLSEQDHVTVVVPWSKADVDDSPKTKAKASPVASPSADVPASAGPPVAAYVVGGVSAAALTVGLVAGGVAWSKKGTIDDNCPDRLCNPDGRRAVDAAKSAALVSTVSVLVGLVGAGTSAWLFLAPPSQADVPSTASLRIHPAIFEAKAGAGFTLEGTLP